MKPRNLQRRNNFEEWQDARLNIKDWQWTLAVAVTIVVILLMLSTAARLL